MQYEREIAMSMSKKDFIALADSIRAHNNDAKTFGTATAFTDGQINMLANFCKSQNSAFMRDRWLGYIAGENGKNGGTVKVSCEVAE